MGPWNMVDDENSCGMLKFIIGIEVGAGEERTGLLTFCSLGTNTELLFCLEEFERGATFFVRATVASCFGTTSLNEVLVDSAASPDFWLVGGV